MRNLVGKCIGKLRCRCCGNISLFTIIGESTNFSSKEVEYIVECGTCCHQYFIDEERIKELLQ